MREIGSVSIVGAGPGDPGLITVAGMTRLCSADVVVHDRLIDPELLTRAQKGAQLIDVGKSRGSSRMDQIQINELLITLAQDGKIVCRLKGGDPFVFGRGGEEAIALTRAKIPWEVVPGVTSAVAVPAYAGIPVTQRGLASSFSIITGSEDPSKTSSHINWDAFATTSSTLVLMMSWETLPSITSELIKHGMSPQKSATLIQWGTTRNQRVVSGQLDDIAELGKKAGIAPPVVTVIGDVGSLRDELAWFDNRPLFGKRVMVTRARTQASRLRSMLEDKGANCVELPLIKVVQVEDPSNLDAAIRHMDNYDWIVFSSSNGVRGLRDRIHKLSLDTRIFATTRVAAVGPATAESVLDLLSLRADLVPKTYVSESVVEEFSRIGVADSNILIIRSDLGRDVLTNGLRDLGANTDEVIGYETKTPNNMTERANKAYSDGIDVTTFTSSSTVDNLVGILNGNIEMINRTVVACMGPITAERARSHGIDVTVIARERTMDSLVDVILEKYS